MFTSIFVASAQPFTGPDSNPASADKNDKMPIILVGVAGKYPDKRVLSGTVAERAGFEPHNTYLVSVQEGESDKEYGRQFTYTNLGKMNMADIISAKKELGAASMVQTVGETATSQEVSAAKAGAGEIPE